MLRFQFLKPPENVPPIFGNFPQRVRRRRLRSIVRNRAVTFEKTTTQIQPLPRCDRQESRLVEHRPRLGSGSTGRPVLIKGSQLRIDCEAKPCRSPHSHLRSLSGCHSEEFFPSIRRNKVKAVRWGRRRALSRKAWKLKNSRMR